ncbi:MAG: hypothetical protein WCB62_22505, partial [Pseudolabrys sp.]
KIEVELTQLQRVIARLSCQPIALIVSCGARARNRSDVTHTNALVSQSETGKINCVHLLYYGRLSPGACSKTTL